MRVVVVGGTGLVGRQVVALLREDGHDAVPASPSTGVDTVTGSGLAAVMRGADVVVDASDSPSFAPDDVLRFFTTSAAHVVDAATAAGVRHVVVLSVVGVDGIDGPYQRAKVRQEGIVRGAGLPWSVVRATQFHEFVGTIADVCTVDGTVRVPPVAFQPVASADVARAVADVAVGAPAGVVEVAGPERVRFDALVRDALAARADPRPVVADPDARYFGAALVEGSLVPAGDARLGGVTFAQHTAG